MGSYIMLMSIFLYLLDVIVNDAAHTQLLLPEQATSSSAVKKVDPQPPATHLHGDVKGTVSGKVVLREGWLSDSFTWGCKEDSFRKSGLKRGVVERLIYMGM